MKYGVSPEQIAAAVALLQHGELVSFPTETVYGLGADAANVNALQKLYAAKGRPSNHPVIVHVAGLEQVAQWAREVPPMLEVLAKQFWPGPLTVVLKRSAHVLDQVTGGQDTVAIRVPAHSVAHALLLEFKGGIAAPSANKFGRLSPTRADVVRREFGDEVSMVLDGGPCNVGIESTILDLSRAKPRILRPGMITADEIVRCIGMELDKAESADKVRVPGSLLSHYAPSTPVVLVESEELLARVKLLSTAQSVAVISFMDKPDSASTQKTVWRKASTDAAEFAQSLYQNMRELDDAHCAYIVVERPPTTAQWHGVLDRLGRAACSQQ